METHKLFFLKKKTQVGHFRLSFFDFLAVLLDGSSWKLSSPPQNRPLRTFSYLRPKIFDFDQFFRRAFSSFLTKKNLVQKRGHFFVWIAIVDVKVSIESYLKMIKTDVGKSWKVDLFAREDTMVGKTFDSRASTPITLASKSKKGLGYSPAELKPFSGTRNGKKTQTPYLYSLIFIKVRRGSFRWSPSNIREDIELFVKLLHHYWKWPSLWKKLIDLINNDDNFQKSKDRSIRIKQTFRNKE